MARSLHVDRDALSAQIDPRGMLAIRVTPNARHESIEIVEGLVRVRVTVPPEDGKANKAVIALIANALGLPKSAVSVARGETAREKWLKIST